MARLSDLQGLLRGLAKLSTAAARVSPGEAAAVWHHSLLKPVTQQAVRLVLEVQGGEGGGARGRKGIPPSQALDNLPLVLEGAQVAGCQGSTAESWSGVPAAPPGPPVLLPWPGEGAGAAGAAGGRSVGGGPRGDGPPPPPH